MTREEEKLDLLKELFQIVRNGTQDVSTMLERFADHILDRESALRNTIKAELMVRMVMDVQKLSDENDRLIAELEAAKAENKRLREAIREGWKS